MINAVSIPTEKKKVMRKRSTWQAPKREDGSPAERLSGKVVMEGSF